LAAWSALLEDLKAKTCTLYPKTFWAVGAVVGWTAVVGGDGLVGVGGFTVVGCGGAVGVVGCGGLTVVVCGFCVVDGSGGGGGGEGFFGVCGVIVTGGCSSVVGFLLFGKHPPTTKLKIKTATMVLNTFIQITPVFPIHTF